MRDKSLCAITPNIIFNHGQVTFILMALGETSGLLEQRQGVFFHIKLDKSTSPVTVSERSKILTCSTEFFLTVYLFKVCL